MRWMEPKPFDLDAWLAYMAENPADPAVADPDDRKGYPLLLKRRKPRAPAKPKQKKRQGLTGS